MEASEDDYMHAAELESVFAEIQRYTAESRAGEILLDWIFHWNNIRLDECCCSGWKLRVLLAQALFSNPDIICWMSRLTTWISTPFAGLKTYWISAIAPWFIISHDRHFLNSVCTHMADMDYGELRVYPGNYDDYMIAVTEVRERLLSGNAKKKSRLPNCKPLSVASLLMLPSQTSQPACQAIDKIKLDEVKPSSRVSPFLRLNKLKNASFGAGSWKRKQRLWCRAII